MAKGKPGWEIKKIGSSKDIPLKLLLSADPDRKSIEKYLESGIKYAVFSRTIIIGIAIVHEKQEDCAEIMNIAVEPNYQHMGVGRSLLEFVISDAKKIGVGRLEVGTGNSSVFQLLLYQQCGFRISGIDFDYFRRNYILPIYENGIECRDMIRLSLDLR